MKYKFYLLGGGEMERKESYWATGTIGKYPWCLQLMFKIQEGKWFLGHGNHRAMPNKIALQLSEQI